MGTSLGSPLDTFGHTLCVSRFAEASMWTVHVGQTEQPVHGAESLSVEQIVYHSRYRPKGLDYDIALIKLTQPLLFTGTCCPLSSCPLCQSRLLHVCVLPSILT